MKMWVSGGEPPKNYCRKFIYSINKKTGLEQKIWASKSAVESVRTDLVGDNWLCVDIAY
ncbi:hypothetical protein [Spiroplasma endosymbiont of 'Nebria riversi']|uniref:hypothetical protein n=1 Tax=Spiroplasma endosymbiont of 'Nebria riversi' TaxID=2792084 RepID=UPI001C056D38|nr:hypothetical protein [Spiroplasma endosymbiont of 'Nebria riversi']